MLHAVLEAAVFLALQGRSRQSSPSPGEQRGQALLWGTAHPALALPWPCSHPKGCFFTHPKAHTSTKPEQAALEKNKGSICKPHSPRGKRGISSAAGERGPALLLLSTQEDQVLQGCLPWLQHQGCQSSNTLCHDYDISLVRINL